MTPFLRATHLFRNNPQGSAPLLDVAEVTLSPGERVVVEGPSGSGKTLLLRALAVLDHCDRGQVFWRGEHVARHLVPQYRASVTYLHQRPAFFEDRVEAALRQPFSLGVHRDRAFDPTEVVGLLERLGRDEAFLEKPLRELSGGELQLLALVRVLQLEPTVLLLDEPTAALDPATSSAAEQLLTEWVDRSKEDRAWIWVTHAAEQAARVASRRLTMESGRLLSRANL